MSYIDFSDWAKKKKQQKSKTWRWCFQYAVTVALNYGEIELHPETASNIKPFINKYNW